MDWGEDAIILIHKLEVEQQHRDSLSGDFCPLVDNVVVEKRIFCHMKSRCWCFDTLGAPAKRESVCAPK